MSTTISKNKNVPMKALQLLWSQSEVLIIGSHEHPMHKLVTIVNFYYLKKKKIKYELLKRREKIITKLKEKKTYQYRYN